jgi:hypothetical protein
MVTGVFQFLRVNLNRSLRQAQFLLAQIMQYGMKLKASLVGRPVAAVGHSPTYIELGHLLSIGAPASGRSSVAP